MPKFPESSKLEQPHMIEGTMKEAKDSLYELARERVRLMNGQEYSDWLKKFGDWAVERVGHSPAVVAVWPRKGEQNGNKVKGITHLEIGVNKDKFQIDGEDYLDILPFAIEHEIYEAWLISKKGLGEESGEKEGDFKKYTAKHRLAVRREFFVAEQQGLGEKLFRWHIKIEPNMKPEKEAELRIALEKAKQRIKK